MRRKRFSQKEKVTLDIVHVTPVDVGRTNGTITGSQQPFGTIGRELTGQTMTNDTKEWALWNTHYSKGAMFAGFAVAVGALHLEGQSTATDLRGIVAE